MLITDLKVAVRSLIRSRTYTTVSLVGLVCAMVCSILVLGRALEEYRYVTYYENGDRIYQVVSRRVSDGGIKVSNWVPGGVAVGLRSDFPDDIKIARAFTSIFSKNWIQAGGKTLEIFFAQADSQFFDIFEFKLVRGHVSADPHTAVITQSAAKRLFDDTEPIGQVVSRPGSGQRDVGTYRITGIMKDLPKYAHLKLEVVAAAPVNHRSAGSRRMWEGWTLGLFGPKCFVMLPEGYPPEQIERAINNTMRTYLDKEITEDASFHLQPMNRVHLHWLYEYGYPGESPADYLSTLALIALIMVFIASANFSSLAIVRVTTRVREIRTRKAVGAGRAEVFRQFLVESSCLCVAALVIGFVVTLNAPFPDIFGHVMSLSALTNPAILLGAGGILLFVTLLAGIYPAILAARTSPAGPERPPNAHRRFTVRNSLIITQLASAVFFIVSAYVIQHQTEMMRTAELGFAKSHLFSTRSILTGSANRFRDVLRDELRRLPGIVSATSLWPGPGAPEQPRQVVYRSDDPESRFDMQVMGIDPYFIETYQTTLLSGRNIGPDKDPSGRGWFLLNETAIDQLGYADIDSPIGHEIVVGDRRGPIIGVIKNFHSESLHGAIEPTVFHNWARTAITIRVSGSKIEETLTSARKTWMRITNQPVTFHSVEGWYDHTYRDQTRRSDSFQILAGTAIILAAFGIFGMASYETERRGKEVGIRKVLGATIWNIVSLFWCQYAFLLVAANLVAWPVGYLLMRDWLTNFAYRIELTSLPFLVAGGLTAGLFLVVVGSQALRIGRIDPARTISQET